MYEGRLPANIRIHTHQTSTLNSHLQKWLPINALNHINSCRMSRTTVFFCKFVGTVGLGLLTVSWLHPQDLLSEINSQSYFIGPKLHNIYNDDSCSVSTSNHKPRTLHVPSSPQRDVSTASSSLHNRRLVFTPCICPLPASGATSIPTLGDLGRRPGIWSGNCGSL